MGTLKKTTYFKVLNHKYEESVVTFLIEGSPVILDKPNYMNGNFENQNLFKLQIALKLLYHE